MEYTNFSEKDLDRSIYTVEDKLLRATTIYEIDKLRYNLQRLRSMKTKAHVRSLIREF